MKTKSAQGRMTRRKNTPLFSMAGLAVILVVASTPLPAGAGNDYYVKTDGDDTKDGLTIQSAWRHPSHATQQAQAGDTIYLMDGTWQNEHVVFSNSGTGQAPITLTAYSGCTPILDGMDRTGSGIAASDKSHITISCICVRNYYDGIVFDNKATNITLTDFTVYNMERSGVRLHGNEYDANRRVSNVSVSNFTAYATGFLGSGYSTAAGVHATRVSDVEIHDFVVRDTFGGGINTSHSERIHIHHGSTISTGGGGVRLGNSTDDSIVEYVTVDNSQGGGDEINGICVNDYSIGNNPCHNNIIRHCHVIDAGHNAIDLHSGAYNTIVTDNLIERTPRIEGHAGGIYFHNLGDGCWVENNTIYDINNPLYGGPIEPPNYIRNATFINNTVYRGGGSIFQSVWDGQLDNIQFINNEFIDSVTTGSILMLADATNSLLKGNSFINPQNPGVPQIWIWDNLNTVTIEDLADKTTKIRAENAVAEILFTDGRVFSEDGAGSPVWYPDKSSYLLNSQTATFTVYDMTAVPDSDSANITVSKFDTSLPLGEVLVDFTAETNDGNEVLFTVWTLNPGHYYLIKKDGVDFAAEQADSFGYIEFSNSEWSAGTFTIELVPEPGVMFLLAVGGLALLRRRRKV